MSELKLVPKRQRTDYRKTMHEYVDYICDYLEAADVKNNGIAGFCIVGVGLDGSFSRGTCINGESFLSETLFPSIVADILRRDTARTACIDVLEGNL